MKKSNVVPAYAQCICAFVATCVVLALSGCGAGKSVSLEKKSAEANRLAEVGDYANAILLYKELDAQASMDSLTLRWATIAAQATGDNALACKWGVVYSSKGDTAKLVALSKSLRAQGRSQDWADLTEQNIAVFRHVFGGQSVAADLSDYYASVNSPKLEQSYNELTDNSLRLKYFPQYFQLVKDKLSQSDAEKLCSQILKNYKDNKVALDYIARTKYDRAETKFKSAYADYEKHNKTTAAHAYLARDLKQLSGEYRNCKSLFEKLHKLEPENKNYIKYLININLRLENKTEAKRLEGLL